jgi:transcriptional regulator with XRE-family HTH domain
VEQGYLRIDIEDLATIAEVFNVPLERWFKEISSSPETAESGTSHKEE